MLKKKKNDLIKIKLAGRFFVSWYKQGNNWVNLCWNVQVPRNFCPENFLMFLMFFKREFLAANHTLLVSITYERGHYRARSVWYQHRDLSRTNGFQFSSKFLTGAVCWLIPSLSWNCFVFLTGWWTVTQFPRPGLNASRVYSDAQRRR